MIAEPTSARRRENLLRLPEVRRRTGLSTPTIYRKMAAGGFPRRVQIGENSVAWYEGDVDQWVADPMGWKTAAAT